MLEARPNDLLPTPERQAKGAFRLAEGEDAGVKHAIDDSATVIQRYFDRGVIDRRQLEAAEIAENAIRALQGSPSSRSCLNFDPVGHDEDDVPEGAVREYNELRSSMTFPMWMAVWDTCFRNETINKKHHNRLCQALDRVADVRKVPK